MSTSCTGDDEPAGPAPPASALRYRDVSAGYYHTCALTPGGTAYCWGGNAFGTLGDGTREPRALPTRVAGGRTFVALDAGAGHNCALTSAGAAWCVSCWGGAVRDLRARDPAVTALDARVRAASAAAGAQHICLLSVDGYAYCGGANYAGQLGDGTLEDRSAGGDSGSR